MMAFLITAALFWGIRAALTPPKTPPAPPRTVRPYANEMLLYRPYQFTDFAVAVTGQATKNPYLRDLAALRPVTVTAPETPDPVARVVFKAHEPRRFAEFEAQPHIMRPLEAAVRALEPHERVISHRLLTGLPGRGKTLIARVLSNELQERALALGLDPLPYVETYAANLSSVDDFDAVAQTLLTAGGGIWFIDEIHVLPKDLATKLYILMEDGLYAFHGSVSPTPLPDVMLIGATTDYGSLHDALKRRFGEALMVRGLSPDELAQVIRRTSTIDAGAVDLLVSRTHWSGAPWEAVALAREARTFAKADGRTLVEVRDVQTVFEIYEIDARGLRWTDRQVLAALYQRPRYRGKSQELVCYAASEGDLCAVVGLDPEEYRATVKPRLLSRGFVEVRSGYGQALTPAGVAWYLQGLPSTPSPRSDQHPLS